MPTASTRLFALLGNPVQHSLSPILHNAAFEHAGIDASYVALRCRNADVRALLLGLARAGGGGNVTIPHKGVAAQSVEVASRSVRATRACNVFWLRRRKVHGENTDVPAFARALKQVIDDVRDTRVLVLGAGGAARAALYSLLEDGCAEVTVLARSRQRSAEIRSVAGRKANRVVFTTTSKTIRGAGFDLVVNTTPLGLRSTDELPLRFELLGGLTAVFDTVYQPGGTRWTRYARSFGVPAADGSEMLIRQAAAAFEIWFEADAPLDAMRRAFARALRAS